MSNLPAPVEHPTIRQCGIKVWLTSGNFLFFEEMPITFYEQNNTQSLMKVLANMLCKMYTGLPGYYSPMISFRWNTSWTLMGSLLKDEL
ncbi:hypothetical protein TNCV_3410071 [Trichonephila clavipes]|nr:hypothetical protein TNCV_3410071 [Trichonephila clavipes]